MTSNEYNVSKIEQDNNLYAVEKIMDKRRSINGQVEYLIRWKDYSPINDTWEPATYLYKTCSGLIRQYNSRIKSQKLKNLETNKHKSSLINGFVNNNCISNKTTLNSFNDNSKPLSDSNNTSILSPKCTTQSYRLKNTQESHKLPSNSIILLDNNEIDEPNSSNQKTNSSNNTISSFTSSCSTPIKSITEQTQSSHPYMDKSLPSVSIQPLQQQQQPILQSPTLPTNVSVPANNKRKIVESTPSLLSSETSNTNNLIIKQNQADVSRDKRLKFDELNSLQQKQSNMLPNIILLAKQLKHKQQTYKVKSSLPEIAKNKDLEVNSQIPSTKFNEQLNITIKNLPYQQRKFSDNTDNNNNNQTIRQSSRRRDAANKFREIKVRKNIEIGLTEIIIDAKNKLLPNSFNNKVLDDFTLSLQQAAKDSTKVVLIRSCNSIFSSGIDLQDLLKMTKHISLPSSSSTTSSTISTVHLNGCIKSNNTNDINSHINHSNEFSINHSSHLANSISNNHQNLIQLTKLPDQNNQLQLFVESLKKFLLALLDFPKPIIVGVKGPAIGLGCAILPLCDIVYASESASFAMPYTLLNQISEAGASLTFPLFFGMASANQLLIGSRQWTAKEALNKGLVSEIMFSEKFHQELLTRCKKLCTVPSKSLELMKCFIRTQHRNSIHNIIQNECDQLISNWRSDDFRLRAQEFINYYLPKLSL